MQYKNVYTPPIYEPFQVWDSRITVVALDKCDVEND